MSANNPEIRSTAIHVPVPTDATPAELWRLMCEAARLSKKERNLLKKVLKDGRGRL